LVFLKGWLYDWYWDRVYCTGEFIIEVHWGMVLPTERIIHRSIITTAPTE
jgi:hypothetical protein